MARFKIHFEDNYGSATITCETREEFNDCLKNIKNDPYEASRMDKGCRTIVEDTVKQLRYQIAGIRKVVE